MAVAMSSERGSSGMPEDPASARLNVSRFIDSSACTHTHSHGHRSAAIQFDDWLQPCSPCVIGTHDGEKPGGAQSGPEPLRASVHQPATLLLLATTVSTSHQSMQAIQMSGEGRQAGR